MGNVRRLWGTRRLSFHTAEAGDCSTKSQGTKLPRGLLTAGAWVYAHSWPPSKVQSSHDGVKWSPMPNEKSYFVHAVAFGDLAGTGLPPKLPGAKTAPVANPK